MQKKKFHLFRRKKKGPGYLKTVRRAEIRCSCLCKELDKKLTSLDAELSQLEKDISAKEDQIENTKAELEEAKAVEKSSMLL